MQWKANIFGRSEQNLRFCVRYYIIVCSVFHVSKFRLKPLKLAQKVDCSFTI